MIRHVLYAAALMIGATAAGPAFAQTVDPAGTVAICSQVIDLQYSGDASRDGQCIAAVEAYLTSIGAKSAGADAQVSDLVALLAELYRDDPECKIAKTELPEAIAAASAMTYDSPIATELLSISEQINSCQFVPTQATNDVPASD